MAKTVRYGARLNAFKLDAASYWPNHNRVTTLDLLGRAASAGLDSADLNYPDHFEDLKVSDLGERLDGLGMELNGLATRYYSNPIYNQGAFTNPDPLVRQAAVDLTRRGIDAAAELGSDLMTLWMGQDGFDYSFQCDYGALWDYSMEALAKVTAHNPAVQIALEYKPNEPRAFALMPDVATTLLAIRELGAPNMGVTIDFAHVLYADEMPAHAVSLINRHSKLLGVQMNDGYGKRDDGLMIGSVHPIQTVELLVTLLRVGYDRAIYFDTFPDHSGLDPVEEARTNIEVMEHLWVVARELLEDKALEAAMAAQNAPLSQRIVQAALLGRS